MYISTIYSKCAFIGCEESQCKVQSDKRRERTIIKQINLCFDKTVSGTKVKPCLTLLDKVSMILIFRKEFINVNTDVVNLWN